MSIKVISGYGQLHTNEFDPKKPDRVLKPYLPIDWGYIQNLVDNPQEVIKEHSQWIIPSSYPSRKFKAQEQNGEYWLLWADLDKTPPAISELKEIIPSLIGGCDYELYNSRGATIENPKARILIPLDKPLCYADWNLAQETLNDKLEALGIEPDRASERAAQLCYLPNRGAIYDCWWVRDNGRFNPMQSWQAEIAAKREKLAINTLLMEQAKQAAMAKKAALKQPDNFGSLTQEQAFIELKNAFNETYTPQEWLTTYGYDPKGNSFRHPNSESGSFSCGVKEIDGIWKAHALSPNDPLYSNGQGAHDAFSTFCTLMHGGDKNAAIKDAGDNLLAIDCVSWNKAKQREYMKQQDKASNNDNKQEDSKQHKDGNKDTEEPKAKTKTKFKLVDVGEIMTASVEPDWLIEGLFERSTVGQLFGKSGHGKSFCVLDMAYCIATGIDYHGRETSQANVTYICGEGKAGISKRLLALEQKYKASITGNMTVSEQPGALIKADTMKSMAEAIKEQGGVGLVIVDTYHRNMGGGKEDSSDDFGIILGHIDTYFRPLGVTTLIVHHSGHGVSDRARGSSAMFAAYDFEYMVACSPDKKKLTLTNTKMKDFEPPKPLLFEFEKAHISVNGSESTSLTLNYIGDAVVREGKARLKKADELAFSSIYEAIRKYGVAPGHDIKTKFGGFDGINAGRKVVHVNDWRGLVYPLLGSDGSKDPQEYKRKLFKRLREKLHEAGMLAMYDDYYWPIDSDIRKNEAA